MDRLSEANPSEQQGSRLLRIVAPHFIAGVEVVEGRVSYAAPIVRYMIGWPEQRMQGYCDQKGWKIEDRGRVA